MSFVWIWLFYKCSSDERLALWPVWEIYSQAKNKLHKTIQIVSSPNFEKTKAVKPLWKKDELVFLILVNPDKKSEEA